jgi:SPP1 family phage portal protein
MQEESIDVLRKAIEDDIHKISMTPNFSDEKFAGNDSGVAIKYKLISFEINTSTKESYFKNGLLKRIVAYNNYLSKLSKGSSFPAHQVEVIFKRKLPQNDFEASQMISNLQGVVSDKTLVSQLSFVDNAEAEVEASRNDAMQRAERLAQEFGTNNPTGDTNPPPN